MATVLVTVSSTGIGMATAVTLARAGHHVQAAVRNPARALELKAAVAAEKLSVQVECWLTANT